MTFRKSAAQIVILDSAGVNGTMWRLQLMRKTHGGLMRRWHCSLDVMFDEKH